MTMADSTAKSTATIQTNELNQKETNETQSETLTMTNEKKKRIAQSRRRRVTHGHVIPGESETLTASHRSIPSRR